MVSAESMRRDAAEANAENDRADIAQSLGEAIGGLMALVSQINALTKRLDALENEVCELRQLVTPLG